ncbi:MAG: CUB domain-containing protein, partial [Cyanobacteria bacterium J06649_11]
MKSLYTFLISISLLGMVMLGEPLDISSPKKQVLGDEDIQQVFEEYPFVLDYLDGVALSGTEVQYDYSCRENINCFTNWQDIKRSVVWVIIPGSDTDPNDGKTPSCSGVLIRPSSSLSITKSYLLTARHCIYEPAHLQKIQFVFNYERDCNSAVGTENFSNTTFGATVVASSGKFDFTLLELSHLPPIDAFPYYAGWDISENIPQNSFGIHHPSGAYKNISYFSGLPKKNTFAGIVEAKGATTLSTYYLNSKFWKYQRDDMSFGSFEKGSSGSPLFDQSGRVIGILHAMGPRANEGDFYEDYYCEDTDKFFFQMISSIWDNNSTPTSLSPNNDVKLILSPNSNQTTQQGYDTYDPTFSIAYDSYEPNDLVPPDILDLPRVFFTNSKINEGDLFHAEISSSTDVDHYLVFLQNLGSLNITMTPPIGKNYNLEILDASGAPTPNQPLPSGPGQEEIGIYSKTNSGQTLLIIKVTGEGGANSHEDYELSFSFTENCVPNDPNDPAEDLANASSYFGQPLSNASLAQSYQGYISSATDQDFVSFDIQGGGLLNVSLQNLGANYDLELQDAQGGIITSSTTPGTDGEQISEYWLTGTNSTAYLRIFGVNGAFDLCNAYDLNVSWTPGSGCPNTGEPNNSRQLASTIIPDLDINPINNFQINAPLFQQDEDFYKLNVDAQGTLTADLSNLPADYEIRLLDNNGNVIASDPQLGTTPEQVTFAYTSQSVTTTFYLQVVGINGAFDECSPYQISLNWNPTSSCLDNFEPNDDLASSSNTLGSLGLVASNQIIQSKIRTATDKDFFAVELLEEGTLTLSLTNLPLDFDLFLYDQTGNTLINSGVNTGTTSEQIIYTYSDIVDTTLFIIIEGKVGVFDPCNAYQLDVTWVPLNACSPPIDPPDLTIPGAPSLPGLLVYTTTPTFEWIPIPGATTYELRIFEINNTSSTLIYSECVGPSPFTLPSGILEGGKQYKWDLQGTVDCGTCVGPISGVCYFQVDPALAPSCTGITTLSAPSGIISDGSGSNNYNNNSRCAWLIDVPGATSINLNFTSFDTEVFSDFIIVFDGSTINSPVLGIYSGSDIPPNIKSTSSNILVVFYSNEFITYTGWSANYTARFAEVTEYEYWFDDDYANKVNSSAGLTGGFLDTQLPTTGLSPGLHALNIRLKDDLAQWSSVISQYFQKLPEHSGGVPKIVGYEYWF